MPPRTRMVQVVACDTTQAMCNAYRSADPRADIVELRLDTVRDLDLDRLLALTGKAKLLTVRSRAQGGGMLPADRNPLLRRMVESAAEWIDIEPGDEALPCLKRPGGPRRILSYHDHQSTPFDLREVYERLRQTAHVSLVKIVTYADAATDILRIRDLLREARGRDLIAFCMGAKGRPSRILASRWGSAAIYAPLRDALPTAPGQLTLEELMEVYRFRRIGRKTRLLGVVGEPVGHSLSPRMHNAAIHALHLDYRYLPFEVSTVAEFLPLITELRIAGLSVTLPFKERFLPHLDRIDAAARRAGSVNTVRKSWNYLEGYNTDVSAALQPLRRLIRLRGATVGVLGAGGAARALVEGLCRRGAQVTLFSRSREQGTILARRFGARALPWSRARRFRCDLLINATPVGMWPDTARTPIPATWIAAPMVYDLIYNPTETLLLKRARRLGARVLGGTEMFIAQGAAQFRLFTGASAPLDVMRDAVEPAANHGAPPGPAAAGPQRTSRGKSRARR